ncbi:GT4 family glycosyltransferase PelF [Pontibacillus salicampi]|uniref:GT4 family glycosyltransferase PelF n=1 Tax=Pontibacillus salicampi TaxID=1449801 RepID=A0ABV6LQF4_9BACI
MKIGIIVEGSYPYVSGGVASWTHTIINQMPEHEFEIIAITPRQLGAEAYRYDVPDNVTGITNLPLNMHRDVTKKKPSLTKEEEQVLLDWLLFRTTDSRALHLFANKSGSSDCFFSSKLFWNIVQRSYEEEEQTGSFINYFWMWRGMYAPVMELLQYPFPKVDIVHTASTGYAGLVGAAMKDQQHIPYIVTEHGIYSREREEEILQAKWIPDYYKHRWVQFYHHLSRQAYQQADDVITLFERNSHLQHELGAPSEKLSIIPNGIHYDRLSQLEKEEVSPLLRIGAIVRVVPIKDIKTMINAAKIMAEAHLPFEMIIMGPLDEEKEYADECQQLVKQYRLEEYVFFVGKVNIMEYLPRFDLCLLTSISEGQPLAVLEGMAAGIPWVTTDVGSCHELLNGASDDRYGPAGFVVPPVHPSKIAEACQWFFDHPNEMIKFGENGQKRVQTYYQVQQFISQYRNLYERREMQYGGHRI